MNQRDDRVVLIFALAWGALLGLIPLVVWYSLEHLIAALTRS